MRDPPLRSPPPKKMRWGYRVRVHVFTSLVRHHHRASIWLCSFITACMEAAWMHPHASSPETSSWRERLRAPKLQLELDGLLCVVTASGGVWQPLRRAPQLDQCSFQASSPTTSWVAAFAAFPRPLPLLASAPQHASVSAGEIFFGHLVCGRHKASLQR